MAKFRVLRPHQGDKFYAEGDIREVAASAVPHLIGKVLAPFADDAPETVVPAPRIRYVEADLGAVRVIEKAETKEVVFRSPSAIRAVAVHRGRGSYSVMVDGVETAEGLTKQDAAEFNALTDEAKADFIAARKG